MTTYPLGWAPLFKVGLLAGLANVAVGVVLYLSGAYFEPWALLLMTLLLPAYIAVGNWWYGKHVLCGQTTYPKALLAGVVITVMIALTYITYNVISITVVYGHFLEDMVQAAFARASAGMDAAKAAQLLDTLRAQMTLKSLVVGNFLAVCRIGTAFSALIALGFLKRWRRAGQAVPAGV
ncbi:MAG: DUF4199 domain-containing protein [Acidobacteria bacterium]|nr:MAG: DUF4199 domain-containing protein [Acidobacteriota bacterium]